MKPLITSIRQEMRASKAKSSENVEMKKKFKTTYKEISMKTAAVMRDALTQKSSSVKNFRA